MNYIKSALLLGVDRGSRIAVASAALCLFLGVRRGRRPARDHLRPRRGLRNLQEKSSVAQSVFD